MIIYSFHSEGMGRRFISDGTINLWGDITDEKVKRDNYRLDDVCAGSRGYLGHFFDEQKYG